MSLAEFWEAWSLFELPALAGVLIGATLGLLGVYVVLRRLVFLAAATSQAASLGVVAVFFTAALLGDPSWLPSPLVGALLLSFIACLLLMGQGLRQGVARDATLGGVFLVGAAGTLFLGGFVTQELHDVQTLLLGNAVAVLPEQFETVAWLMPTLLVVHLVWWRGVAQASFGYADARVRGLPVQALEIGLLLSLAAAISVGTRTIGALPVFAMSVLPAVVATRIAANLPLALALAAVVGGLVGLYGYLLGAIAETPVGPSQVLIGALFALLATAGGALPTGRPAPAWLRPGLRVASAVIAAAGVMSVFAPLLSAWWPEAPALAVQLAWGLAILAVLLAGLLFRGAQAHRACVGAVLVAVWLLASALLLAERPLIGPIVSGAGALALARLARRAATREPAQVPRA